MNKNLNLEEISEYWRGWFMEGPPPNELRQRSLFRLLPSDPRCTYCLAPFKGVGGWIAKAAYNKQPSSHHPGYCNVCDNFAQKFGGGAEVEMAMLFVDIRGSTQLSSTLSPREFSRRIEVFYSTSTRIIVENGGFIERLAGDEVIAYFGPGIAGDDYAAQAVRSGQEILKAASQQSGQEAPLPLGGGVHVGTAFFGSVLSPNGMYSITALGEEVNKAARLASEAGTSELIVSHAAIKAAGLDAAAYPTKELRLKGVEKPVTVSVITVEP